MARIGVAITKSTSFRGASQEFSNVYYYENGGSLPSVSQADAIIDELVALEKQFHSSLVSFVQGRVWSQGGSPSTNNMISTKTLTGTGSSLTVGSFDKERAFLFRWRAGNDSRGNAVYLRKWYHSCGQLENTVSITTNILGNTASFTAGERTTMENKVGPVSSLAAGGGPWTLVAKSGRTKDSSFPSAHAYLEHRQLGDMWRGT